MGKSFRLPNGYGSIYKLSGNRRRPYAIAKTFGWDDNGKQIKKIIGYAETKTEALNMLLEYNKDPYDIDQMTITVNDVYLLVIEKIKKMVAEQKMSKSNYNGLKNAYLVHCKNIYKIPIKDLTYKVMQNTIDICPCGQTTKGYIKNILTKIYEYSKLELGIKLDLDLPKHLNTGDKSKSEMHKPFTDQELNLIWDNYYKSKNDKVEIVLIMLYTGLRPQELIDIETEKVFIEENYMIGGCKTQAGKNRIIPIHDKIKDFIEKRLNGKYLIMINNRKANYKDISKIWNSVMNEANLKHYPYDSRHTLATRLDNYKILHPNEEIDDLTIKLILGHAINDVTQNVYIHRDAKYLVKAINLLY